MRTMNPSETGTPVKGNFRIRDFSEPLVEQRDTTSYSQRFYTSYDIDPTANVMDLTKYESEKIKQWRAMARNPYIDFAIDDIVNEMVSTEDDVVFPKHRFVFNGIPETYIFIRGVGYDKAVQEDVRVA